MAFFKELAARNPTLKRKLSTAHINKTPEAYIREKFNGALMMALMITVASFMLVRGLDLPLIIIPVTAILSFFILFQLFLRTADVEIHKLAKDIDREVLFAGRFLLVKLNSGAPLMNALTDASRSYGVANKYFKEIVRDIELGTPLEHALERASRYSPSEKFRRILFQISNALRIGVDISSYLEAVLDEIAEDQLIEIKRYGKKLSGLTMFYMLLAIVLPSLGITLFITVVSFLNVTIDIGLFLVLAFMLVFVMFVFITIFKAARPNVNL